MENERLQGERRAAADEGADEERSSGQNQEAQSSPKAEGSQNQEAQSSPKAEGSQNQEAQSSPKAEGSQNQEAESSPKVEGSSEERRKVEESVMINPNANDNPEDIHEVLVLPRAWLVFYIIVVVVKFLMGCIFVGNCEVQPKIPLYLILDNIFFTIFLFHAEWTKCLIEKTNGRYRSFHKAVCCILGIGYLVWLVFGGIWVYSVYSDVDLSRYGEKKYCNRAAYFLAFWNVTFQLLYLFATLAYCGFKSRCRKARP